MVAKGYKKTERFTLVGAGPTKEITFSVPVNEVIMCNIGLYGCYVNWTEDVSEAVADYLDAETGTGNDDFRLASSTTGVHTIVLQFRIPIKKIAFKRLVASDTTITILGYQSSNCKI